MVGDLFIKGIFSYMILGLLCLNISVSAASNDKKEKQKEELSLKAIEEILHTYFSKEVDSDVEELSDYNSQKRGVDYTGDGGDSRGRKYVNEWAVHLMGGTKVAEQVVQDLGYEFRGPVRGFKDIYKVSHRYSHQIRKKRETKEITHHISSQNEVVWAEQQYVLEREKREIYSYYQDVNTEARKPNEYKSLSDSSSLTAKAKMIEKMFNDELWPSQWYLFDTRTLKNLPELHMNVIPVWASGITGKGIKVSIVDDGLQWKHVDLIDNYDPLISYDANDDDDDPSPGYPMEKNSHGTKCAGEVAMKPNNMKCGVGVAHGAKIGGVRLLDGPVTDTLEAIALQFNVGNSDIVSCSWGPKDNGKTVEGPQRMTKIAIENGINEGRDGKGIIFVWAGGNGGSFADNCNCDGYASSIYTISISSASQSGLSPWYAELCSSSMATTYSSGAYTDQKISSVGLNDTCTTSFSGTSAAAPLAAGIIALALEANPEMTWRDVQHAIAITSSMEKLKDNDGWQTNAKGLKFNLRFGFGLLDADGLVTAAKKWVSVPEKVSCSVGKDFSTENNIIGERSLIIEFKDSGCEDTEFEIRSLEHVEVITTIRHPSRGSLIITITSPSGTPTTLLTQRPDDVSSSGFNDWPFVSVHTWGEDPRGTWVVEITDTNPKIDTGTIDQIYLVLHGTTEVPHHLQDH